MNKTQALRVTFDSRLTLAILLLLGLVALTDAQTEKTEGLDLTGTVEAKSGQPVQGTVFIYTAEPRHGFNPICPSCYADCLKSAESDSSGKFTIESVSGGLVFQVLVVAPGYEPKFFNRVDPLSGPLEARLDLRPANNVPPQQIITGQVVNTQGEPLANAVVSVAGTTIDDETSCYPPKGTDPVAITDARGDFSLQSVVKFDAMDLRLEARGYAPRNFSHIKPGLKPVQLALAEGAAVTGKVLWNGKPLSGITIGMAGVDCKVGEFVGFFVAGTDENGRFLFPNLPADLDYAFYGLMKPLQPFGALPTRIIHLGMDGSVTNLGALQVVPGYRLAGQVKLSDGKPIPKFSHLLIGRPQTWDSSMIVELPPDGRFDFTNIPSETISISTTIEGYRFSPRNASLDPLGPSELVGQLDSDKTNLIVLLEPGKPLQPDYAENESEEGAFQKLPLGGAESKRLTVFDAESKIPIRVLYYITPAVFWDHLSHQILPIDGENHILLLDRFLREHHIDLSGPGDSLAVSEEKGLLFVTVSSSDQAVVGRLVAELNNP
ncbi:MAG TPA: carboxypeptidase-like regulatory domain-containing protein [Verrucomicrobiae bacterium]|nr:carboxypeptidase-like regulatory domain-containing protein [Verrucomicrobiae bacterium]